MITKEQQKEYLRLKLSTDPSWAKAALLRIYGNQTEAEQISEDTKELNGIGFTGPDAQILSSFANQLLTKRFLSDKQMSILMTKIKKYWKQILDISDIDKLNSQIAA